MGAVVVVGAGVTPGAKASPGCTTIVCVVVRAAGGSSSVTAMTELSDRERHILTERRLKDEPTTLEELAGQYGVSRERVRQIEVRAFEKLQKSMRAAALEKRLIEA